jgi:hypothetical protein
VETLPPLPNEEGAEAMIIIVYFFCMSCDDITMLMVTLAGRGNQHGRCLRSLLASPPATEVVAAALLLLAYGNSTAGTVSSCSSTTTSSSSTTTMTCSSSTTSDLRRAANLVARPTATFFNHTSF